MPKKSATPKPKGPSVQELTADIQRIQAEFVNYKARAERDKLDAINIGKEKVIYELLSVFDNIQRAFEHAPEDLLDNSWVKGILSLEKQLSSTLQNIGLTRIKTIGEQFDPNTMEAVSVEDGDGEEIVTAEIQAGYTYNGKIIRPALVKVTR